MNQETPRKICSVDGCPRKARNKGHYKGAIRYGNKCVAHHKSKDYVPYYEKNIPNDQCELCGWDKSSCDRHRVVPELGYTKENVRILCPNCHRLVTVGVIEI